MRRRLVLSIAIALAVLATACSSDDSDADSSDSGDDGDEVANTAAPDDGPTSTSSTTTVTIPEEAEPIPALQIVNIQFGDDGFVEITNTGDEDASVAGIWLCQFPTYIDLGTVIEGGVIAAGATAQVPAGRIGGLSIDGGEAALYTANEFTDPAAIFGFVQWGSGGARAGIATTAGIWPDGATVDPDPEFGNIELFGDPADPESWS